MPARCGRRVQCAMPSEFELIRRYFSRPARRAVLGVGDDAALVRLPREMELAVSTDMLVCGTHFLPAADPRRLGHKALAVNLSDMAAMGAQPRWAFLSLSLPKVDVRWLRAFSSGFYALARAHGVDLAGGDTTRGPLNLCITILGAVPRGKALRRDGARPLDDIWVSGALGTAALGLAHRQGRIALHARDAARCARALDMPQPRIRLGIALRGLANSAIDVSDGVLADLGHICERSQLGADVWLERIPHSRLLSRVSERAVANRALIAGGDDYELCFTASAARRGAITRLARRVGVPLSCVGSMRAGRGVRLIDSSGREIAYRKGGFDHFG